MLLRENFRHTLKYKQLGVNVGDSGFDKYKICSEANVDTELSKSPSKELPNVMGRREKDQRKRPLTSGRNNIHNRSLQPDSPSGNRKSL